MAATERALAAAFAVARANGLPTEDARVLRDLTNLIVHFPPAPVVARVSITLGSVRDADWDSEQIRIAQFLVDAGAPVAPPAAGLDPGPHLQDGLSVTLWRYVEHDEARVDPVAIGRSLRVLHEALTAYPGRLPTADRLREIEVVLASLPPSEHAGAAELAELRAFVQRLAPLAGRPLHGDAHLFNVLCTPAGPLWSDFENACAGPIEYDLACMAYRRTPENEAAVAAYGAHDETLRASLDPYVAVFLAAMSTHMALLRDIETTTPRVRVERALAYAREM
jgi:hypothetical protein